MLHTIINFLHLAPLAIILLITIAPQIMNLLAAKQFTNSIILILASIGILSGAIDHHHHEYIVDPCFGYVAALVFVAFKLSKVAYFKAQAK